MGISSKIASYIEKSSWIRRMFEEGLELKKKFGEENVFDLTIGNPDLPPPPCVRESLLKFYEAYNPEFHKYMPNAGFKWVRERIAEKVSKETGLKISHEEIIMTCGAAGGLNVIFKTLLNPGDKVLFPSPFFVEYFFYTENHQGVPVPVKTNKDFSLNFEEIEKALTPETKIFLINSPNNPTGVVYSEEELKTLSRILKEKSEKFGHSIYLVSDEPYKNILFDESFKVPSVLNLYEDSFVVYSFSKELSLAGERIGFIAVHPEIKEKELVLNGLILSNRILGFVNAPALSQRIVENCLNEKVDVAKYKKRKEILCEILEEAGLKFVKPSGGFFVFPETPIDDIEFVNHLKKFLILAVPGRGFGLKNHIRLSFCIPEEKLLKMKPLFIKACKELKGKNV